MNPSQPVSYNSGASGGGRRLITIIVLVVLLIASLGFGGWAYKQMQSYKNDTNQKIAAAVSASNQQLTTQLQAQFAQQSKSPYKVFQGSPTFGTITFSYPKTWSGYVDTTNQSQPIEGYFFPDLVPGIQSQTGFALRVELVTTDYSQVLEQFQGDIQQGKVTAKAYLPPKLNGVANAQPGTILSGAINNSSPTQRGTLLVIKVRDKTLEIYTESNDYLSDFNNVILASLNFSP